MDSKSPNWPILEFENVCLEKRGAIISGPFGSNIGRKFFVKDGVPVIRGNNISEKFELFKDDGFVFVSKNKAEELGTWAIEDDLIFTAAGTLGQVGIIPKNRKFDKYIISNKQMRARLDKTKVLPFYAFLWFKTGKMVEYIKSRSTGSTIPLINLSVLRSLPISVPPIAEQKGIVMVIMSLINKIELNQKMNKTLEAIAQAIFKHWFIDFEFPNEEGKPYKSSGGEMVDSELGEIPNGWEVKKITEIGRLKNGINYTRDEKGDEEFYIVNVRDISKSKFIIKDDLNVIKFDSTKCKDYLLNQNDIIIARSASPGESSLILGNIDNVIHSGFSIRYRLSNPNFKWYVYLLLQHSKNILFRYSIGTALKSLNQTAVGNMSIIMPSVDVLRKFNSIDIINKIMSNLLESKALLNIRDLLLPKLIMGKIRVPLEE